MLQKLCFVSTATISRLCRKLNYESFSDFKMDVTMNLRYLIMIQCVCNLIINCLFYQLQEKQLKIYLMIILKILYKNLRSTYEMIEFEELEKLVDLIYQSNEICFAGNFFTQSVSMQLQIELSYLGKKCTGMYPLQSQKVSGSWFNRKWFDYCFFDCRRLLARSSRYVKRDCKKVEHIKYVLLK